MTDIEYRQLLQTFPRMVREVIEGRGMLIMAISLLAIFTVLSSRSSRLWAMVSSALLGPLIASVLLIVKPLNPYDNIYAQIEGKLHSAATGSPYARELIDLLKSSRGALYVAKVALITTLLLSGIFLTVAWAQGPVDLSFDRSQDFNWMFSDTVMLSIGCFGLEAVLALRWALRVMKHRSP
jgi:hypothetical protein